MSNNTLPFNWTKKEEDIIIENCGKYPMLYIADMIGCSRDALKCKIAKMKKEGYVLKSYKSGRSKDREKRTVSEDQYYKRTRKRDIAEGSAFFSYGGTL